MNKVLREFWKRRMLLDKAREKYLISIDRLKICEDDKNHYLNRLNQNVCKAMKQQYKDETKEYQKFLRTISEISFT
jgi:hypothetical protein